MKLQEFKEVMRNITGTLIQWNIRASMLNSLVAQQCVAKLQLPIAMKATNHRDRRENEGHPCELRFTMMTSSAVGFSVANKRIHQR